MSNVREERNQAVEPTVRAASQPIMPDDAHGAQRPALGATMRALAQRVSALDVLRRWRHSPAVQPDPAAAVFAGIRRNLTLWYSAVLAVTLLLAGLVLYLGTERALLEPVQVRLTHDASELSQLWQTRPQYPCPLAAFEPRDTPFATCYELHDGLHAAYATQFARDLPSFVDTSLAATALESPSGYATDVVHSERGIGTMQRYALVVRRPNDNQVLGVVQIGITIDDDLKALHTLLTILVIVGVLGLGAAVLGGMLLSGRALRPARIAFARQQTFIADASHELRTPLTLLRANAEVLLRGRERLDPDDAMLLDDIVAETGHMAALTSNMLTLARMDSGKLLLERDVVPLDKITSNITHRVQSLAESKQVTITLEQSESILVVGDRALIEQAALILVDNALKYNHPGGSITVRSFRDGARARLQVTDSGPGIASEHLPHLGERFYRVEKARSREEGGAGLGLSIARGIAEAHGGALDLTSAPGSGTVATLTLPAAV